MTSTLKGDNGFVTFTFILSGPGATTDDHSAKFPSVEGASIVANITNVENAKNAKVTFTQCNPEVGKLFVIDSNCLTVEVSAPNSKNGRLDIEAALIGDFCKRSPSADVSEKYDPVVVMPADTEVEEFEVGVSDAGSDNDVTDDIKETPKPSSSPAPAPSSARRASVLLSLAVASLAIGATVV